MKIQPKLPYNKWRDIVCTALKWKVFDEVDIVERILKSWYDYGISAERMIIMFK